MGWNEFRLYTTVSFVSVIPSFFLGWLLLCCSICSSNSSKMISWVINALTECKRFIFPSYLNDCLAMYWITGSKTSFSLELWFYINNNLICSVLCVRNSVSNLIVIFFLQIIFFQETFNALSLFLLLWNCIMYMSHSGPFPGPQVSIC